MEARHPKALELGLFVVVVAVPLAFTPFSSAPFGDPKLLLLTLGSLLMALGSAPVDRRLTALATAWVGATALATILGVDPLASLVASTTGNGGGLVFTTCCAVVLVVGAGLPADLRERARGWFAWTGTAVAALLVFNRLTPDTLDSVSPDLSFIGSTMGNQLFAAALVAAAMAAAAGDPGNSRARRWVQLVIMTLGIAVTAERSSFILPLIALPVVGWRSKLGFRRTSLLVAVVIGSFAVWQVADRALPGEAARESTFRQLASPATDTGRYAVWRASARALGERPVTGWGPNTTKSAYLHAATPQEVKTASRAWNDAHDLFLETGVTTGVVGLVSLLALLGLTVARALRSPPQVGWAVGAAAALGAYALVEPLNLVLTPLLFLFAGISASDARATSGEPARTNVSARLAGALALAWLAAGCLLSLTVGASSVYEEQGRRYGDQEALRTALRIRPWNMAARQELSLQLAVDGRAGNIEAAAEARAVIRAGVEQHPWNADVRVFAANVETLLHDDAAARAWLVEQLDRFPGDAGTISEVVNAPTGSTSG